jgi:hypothetical protein
MPFEIQGHGWELHVKRLGLQRRPGSGSGPMARIRCSSMASRPLAYLVTSVRAPVQAIIRHMGKRSICGSREAAMPCRRNSVSATAPSASLTTRRMAFLVLGTQVRTAVLVHPGHPPGLYLSSIECLNPTKPLRADQDMSFAESRARVIAMIDSLRQHDPGAFASKKIGHNTAISDAFVVIDGEPMIPVSDEAIV